VAPAARGVALAVATAAVVVGLDQATKQLAVHAVERGQSENVFFGVDIVNSRNTGVAFGALQGGGLVVSMLIAFALALLLAYFALHVSTPALWLPVGMLFGGALGNVIDRIREGAVIDFIDPVLWPAFNVADASIVLGVLVLLYVIERQPEKA
jgi:signal peptidase II